MSSTTGEATGTFAVIDGLLEGPVPPVENGEKLLRDWCGFAASNGIAFHLEIDGPSFSLLCAKDRVSLAPNEDVEPRVAQCLEQLLKIFPVDLWRGISSTLRSVQPCGEEEVQVAYLVTRDGVVTRSRKVPRRLGSESEEFFERVEARRFVPVLVFLGVLALVFLGSLLVVDYSGVFDSLSSEYALVSEKRYEVETVGVDGLVTVTRGKLDAGRLELRVVRGDGFPTTLEALRATETELRAGGSLEAYLAFEKLVVGGSLRIEYIDGDGEWLGEVELSIRALLDEESTVVRVPVKAIPRARGLRVTY